MKFLFFKISLFSLAIFGCYNLNAAERNSQSFTQSKAVGGYLFLKYNFREKLALPLDEGDFQRFQLAHSSSVPGSKSYLQEWIPAEQNLENWDEMITIGFERRDVNKVSDFEGDRG